MRRRGAGSGPSLFAGRPADAASPPRRESPGADPAPRAGSAASRGRPGRADRGVGGVRTPRWQVASALFATRQAAAPAASPAGLKRGGRRRRARRLCPGRRPGAVVRNDPPAYDCSVSSEAALVVSALAALMARSHGPVQVCCQCSSPAEASASGRCCAQVFATRKQIRVRARGWRTRYHDDDLGPPAAALHDLSRGGSFKVATVTERHVGSWPPAPRY